MIARLIHWSIGNRFLVLLATLFITALGIWSLRNTPVDALPDLSDTQVIIRTSFPGQAPQIVENQVTYPLATTMLCRCAADSTAERGLTHSAHPSASMMRTRTSTDAPRT